MRRGSQTVSEGRRIRRTVTWRVPDQRLEQRVCCTTTATPENRVMPWEVARRRVCHTRKGAAATTRFGRRKPCLEHLVPWPENAAPLRRPATGTGSEHR